MGTIPSLHGKKDVEETIERLSPTKGLWDKRNTSSGVFTELRKSGGSFRGVKWEN